MSILDRLTGVDGDAKLPVHQFFSALQALSDGEVTRGEIETQFAIATTGEEKNELDFLINTYTGIAPDLYDNTSTIADVAGAPNLATARTEIVKALKNLDTRIKELRYLNAVHAIFMLAELDEVFMTKWNKSQIQTWLTNSSQDI